MSADRLVLAHLPWIWDWTAAGWAAGAAWATVGVAVVAALYARRQWLEARSTRDEQTQPYVIVDFEPSPASRIHMELVIRNAGSTVAHDVRFAFDPPLQSTIAAARGGSHDVTTSAILREGIPMLAPGRAYRMLFEDMPALHTSDLPRVYEATVSFTDSRGRAYEQPYRLDLGMHIGWMRLDIYGEHDAAKALREIERTMKQWTDRGNALGVVSYDGDVRNERERAHREAEHAEAEDPPSEP